MPINVQCQCGRKFAAKDEHAGMRAKCPQCGQVITIPKPGVKPSAAAPAKPKPPPPPPPPVSPQYDGKSAFEWIDAFKADDPAGRKRAADALGKVGPEAAIDAEQIAARLTSSHILVRHWAVMCLRQVGRDAAAISKPALIKALSDAEPLIRDKAAQALGDVVPAARAHLPKLVEGLNDKKGDVRAAAIEAFSRNLRTATISRCRFWMCPCGSVFEKEDLEERLKQAAQAETEVPITGDKTCKKCGKTYHFAEVYAGRHDVPQKFWLQIEARFNKAVELKFDPMGKSKDEQDQDQGYSIRVKERDPEGLEAFMPGAPASENATPSGGTKPVQYFDPGEGTEGYGVSADVAHTLGKDELSRVFEPVLAEEEVDTTPGAKVPRAGKYRCTSCGKARLSQKGAEMNEPRQVTIKTFKEGKVFPECPNCEEVTEWAFVE